MNTELHTDGVTRTVILVDRWAIKIPKPSYQLGVHGWLANQSEWRQRRRPDVNPPLLTLFHFATAYRRADELAERQYGPKGNEWPTAHYAEQGYFGDEGKGSSWGRFDDRWLLIDYDRWPLTRGLVGRLYRAHRMRAHLKKQRAAGSAARKQDS